MRSSVGCRVSSIDPELTESYLLAREPFRVVKCLWFDVTAYSADASALLRESADCSKVVYHFLRYSSRIELSKTLQTACRGLLYRAYLP